MNVLKLKALVFIFVWVICPGLAAAQNFAPPANYATGSLPDGSAAADFNNDGNTDIIVANSGSTTLSLFMGNGDGTLGPASTIQIGFMPLSVATGDFNADGNVDVAVSGITGSPVFEVLLGNGDGTFRPPVDVTIPGLPIPLVGPLVITEIAVADLNSDKKPDIVVATANGAAVFLNDGTGNFTFSGNVAQGQIIQNIALADFNNDGIPDIVFMTTSGNGTPITAPNTFLSIGNGDGTFKPASTLPLTTQNPDGIAVADVNKDGLLDVIVDDNGPPGTQSGSIQIALQQPGGSFVDVGTLAIPNPTGVIAVDLDGDGNVDIAATTETAGTGRQDLLEVFPGRGDGSFSAPNQFPVSFGVLHPIAAHLAGTVAFDVVTSGISANEISVLVNHGANTVALASSLNPSAIGQPVVLTATVNPKFPGSGNLSGSLIFADGNKTLGTSTVNSSGSGSLTTSFSSAGNHPLLAVFGGNPSFVGGSSASITQVVNKAAPSATLISSINPSSFGQAVSFSITVSSSSGAPPPTGTVNLLDGSSIILSGALDNAGKSSLSTSFLALGNHTLTAQYLGDGNNTSATSSPLTQTVNKNSSSTILSAAPNPSEFGQSITFTAVVSGSGGASGIPTGSVTFRDGNASIGSSALDVNGRCALSISSLTVGTHGISADYAGDSNFSGSTSGQVSQIVNKGATTTTLTGSPNPSAFGQNVILTATVAGWSNSSAIPTGVVAFADGSISLGTAAIDNFGKASLVVSSFSVGTHSVSAIYPGDGNFSSSTSAPIAQTVNKSSSGTALTANPNPSSFGQPVTFTAVVTAVSGGSGAPSGSVTFSDGTAGIGTAPLDKTGKAVLSVNSLAVGSHSISATYGGDGNFAASSASGGAGVNQIVGQSNTVTAISSTPNPSVFSQVIILTATVTASGGGGGIPSGAVTFVDGASAIGTVPLDSNGNAALTISSFGVGTHSVTASYQGSGNHLPSRSGALSQTVDRDSVVVTLTSVPNPSTFGQKVTFAVRVVPSPPGGAQGTTIPGGTVAFIDGTSVFASVTLDNTGVATVTISSLTAGSHTITAIFGGDANFSKGSSSPYTQTVTRIPTRTSLATSMNPATNTSTITLAAGVLAMGAPTGTITFFDGAQQLGSSTIGLAGNAVLLVPSFSTGSHTLIAAYSGDDNFASSQSSPIIETVVDSRDAVRVTSSANPQVVTKAVTFSVTVSTALGGPVNGGTITFTNGTTFLATIPVVNSKASLTTSNLPVGNDSITAAYQAGPSPGPSDGSAALVEIIDQATPIVVGGGNDEDFTLSVKPGQAQVRAGDTVSAQVALVPVNGLTGFVNISCTGVPRGSTCAIKPNVGAFDGKNPIRATLVVTTSGHGAPPDRPHPPRGKKEGMAWLPLLPIAFGCVVIPKFKRKKGGGLVAVALLTALLTGCGDSTFQTMPLNSNTPPGNYTIIIQAVTGPLAHSAHLQLKVR